MLVTGCLRVEANLHVVMWLWFVLRQRVRVLLLVCLKREKTWALRFEFWMCVPDRYIEEMTIIVSVRENDSEG